VNAQFVAQSPRAVGILAVTVYGAMSGGDLYYLSLCLSVSAAHAAADAVKFITMTTP